MRELSLFSGAGGGIYGTHLLGARVVCYVERDPYCQRVLRQRIADGIFEDAPIFGDVRSFDGRPWRGKVDLLTAGFPCQPFSRAGRAPGADDPKNCWPDTARIIREVRPPLVFLENSPDLTSSGYLGDVLGDLAASGYDAAWSCLSAGDCGAPHVRDRIWVLAGLPDADSERQQATVCEPCGSSPQEPLSPGGVEPSRGWWRAGEDESGVRRLAHGVADRRQRVCALGNGQVPAVVASAFRALYARLIAEV